MLRKIFSASPSKDIKTFLMKELCCHIASQVSIPSNLLPLETLSILVSLPLWIKFIMGQLLLLFVEILKCLLYFFQLRRRYPCNQPFLLLRKLRKFSQEVVIFRCFGIFLVRSPQKFQVQAKKSIMQPVFPDYLSISYDYM